MPRQFPIFPLSNVVLFPDGRSPLHLFEPRYRQMTRDALDGERMIGMVTVRPEHGEEMGGDPPIYEIGCAGFIAEHEELPDGRFAIVLQGTQRFRVLRELPPEGERLYRVADAEMLDDAAGDDSLCDSLRAAILDDLGEIARMTDQELDAEPLESLDARSFVNHLCQSIGLPPQEKQSFLEADDIEERLRRLSNALSFHRAFMEGRSGGSTETVH